ncbi:acetone carboxylase subunit gamma [Panacagrimonas sp.]|uniref:acetone carboxylase subunit gamma n=1 Tax=Panacagrimonas sp. TaxID=2480088 RepID=UPI003B522D20
MKIAMTEYLQIDLEKERWMCRVCEHDVGPARGNYKEGLLVHARDPREIHKPILDTSYEFTFAPDPKWVQIVEYYCPSCGTQMEVEYLTPGHPPLHDMEFDIDALKAQWAKRSPQDLSKIAGPEPMGVEYHTQKSTGLR